MRLLRPLLGFDRDGLRDFLEDQGVPWLVDPSNRDLRYERARLRQGNPLSCHPREETRQTGATRRALEGRVQTALAACVAPHPFGFCGVNLSNFIKEDPTVVDGVLSRVVAWIGGRNYLLAPALATQLRSQLSALKPGQSATAGGCLLTRRKETVVITREPGRLPSVRKMDLRSGDLWDGRFWLEADPTQGGQGRSYNIGPLGSTGVRDVVRSNDLASVSGIPKAAIAALPALWVDGVAVCVPHLFIQRAGESQFSAVFRPRRTLSSPTFAVA
jgi:tRNA(Ile)-lysidine synthase